MISDFDDLISEEGGTSRSSKQKVHNTVKNFFKHCGFLIENGSKFHNNFYVGLELVVEDPTSVEDENEEYIARVVLNYLSPTEDLSKIETIIENNPKMDKIVKNVKPMESENGEIYQILVEFEDYQDKSLRWEVKQLLNSKGVLPNRVTTHKYFYK